MNSETAIRNLTETLQKFTPWREHWKIHQLLQFTPLLAEHFYYPARREFQEIGAFSEEAVCEMAYGKMVDEITAPEDPERPTAERGIIPEHIKEFLAASQRVLARETPRPREENFRHVCTAFCQTIYVLGENYIPSTPWD